MKISYYLVPLFVLALFGCSSDKLLSDEATKHYNNLDPQEIIYADENGNSRSVFPYPKDFEAIAQKEELNSIPEEMSRLLPQS